MNAMREPGVTREIARFVRETRFDDIPEQAIEVAIRCFVDGLAVMLAGSTEPCAVIARKHLEQLGGIGEARTFGAGSMRAPAPLAALANGIAGHALDWDDTALSVEKDRSVLIHPTMQPLCAVLALCEITAASGKDLLQAFALGFDVQVKIAEAIAPEHFAGGRGFHTSGTIGIFGATVASAKLLQLTETETRHALAIAATTASGLGVNHGTMSKPLNMGRAAEGGVTAARLAKLGFDGPHHALEGGRGFFEAFGGGFAPEKILGKLGAPWALLEPGTSIKPYPSGVVGHPGMDAMKTLVEAHDIQPADVDRIDVWTGPNVIYPGPLRIEHATTALEGKFCVPFQMAAIVLARKAGMAEFSDPFVASSDCQELQRRVTTHVDPDIAAMGKDKVVFKIELTTKGGRVFTQNSEEHYRGGPKNPLSWEALCAKFEDCSAGHLDDAATRTAFLTRIRRLAEIEDAATVLELL